MQQIYEPVPSEICSLWLMPCPEDEAFLSALVRELAARFGTPVFAPHLTLRGDTDEAPTRLTEMCEKAAREVPAFAGAICGVETTAAYFMAFYAQVQLAPSLVALKRLLDPEQEAAFVPHVSLLYGDLTAAAKAPAAVDYGLRLSGRALTFDRICVVRSGQDIAIKDWSTLSTTHLRG